MSFFPVVSIYFHFISPGFLLNSLQSIPSKNKMTIQHLIHCCIFPVYYLPFDLYVRVCVYMWGGGLHDTLSQICHSFSFLFFRFFMPTHVEVPRPGTEPEQ